MRCCKNILSWHSISKWRIDKEKSPMHIIFESFIRPYRQNRESIIHQQLHKIFHVQTFGHFGKWILLCRRNCTKKRNIVQNIHLQRTALLWQLVTSTKKSFLIQHMGISNCFLYTLFWILLCDLLGITQSCITKKFNWSTSHGICILTSTVKCLKDWYNLWDWKNFCWRWFKM